MATRDYSSIYTIKEFAINELAPKYFDVTNTNMLNIGLVGYTTDLAANMTEDTFNSFSIYSREIFPNIAQIPETLYTCASMLQIENLFAVPSEMNVVLLIKEQDIIEMGEKKENRIEFVLDSDLIIDVEGKQFMPDYDVLITAKPYRGDYIFTASYNFSFKNSISSIQNPYIKTSRVKVQNVNYLGIIVTTHCVNKFEQIEFIINNDKINLPTISFEFEDQLANFEVFYRSPDSEDFVQLKKKLFNTPPLREPFCFYKIKDENKIEISFTSRDNYFQPKFNSEVMLKIYTTIGADGNFPLYKGDNITVIPKSEIYEYNNTLILYAVPQTESRFGKNKLSLEELREIIIERTSTSGAYNSENDLQLYFSNYKGRDNTQVLFIKKRDDALERLFSAFSLIRDENKDIYPTNTLNMRLYPDNFDLEYEQSDRLILKAGHLFKYIPQSLDTVEIIKNKTLIDDLTLINEEFIYTNPFLMTLSKKQGIVGFYLNSRNDLIPLEYTYVNGESTVQFICNNVTVSRNALMGENFYKIQIIMMPTSTIETPLADELGNDLGIVKVIGAIEDTTKEEICYVDFVLKSIDSKSNLYTFEAIINTDDYMTYTEKFQVTNVKNIETGVEEIKLIPMYDCKLNIYSFFKYSDGVKLAHKFDYLPELYDYSLTNMYSTVEKKINFITPINMMRSRVKYFPVAATETTPESYYMNLASIPLVKAQTMKDYTKYSFFINSIYQQYEYLQADVNKITTNYGIDMKFYNTFGKSKNFIVGEDGERLDRVNCSFKFKVALTIGTLPDEIVRDLKIFIKDYVENINDKGYNSVYISNLIQSIENNFPGVKYLKFECINNYDSSVQVLENNGVNIDSLTKEERRDYVPEYLTTNIEDIIIEIISN